MMPDANRNFNLWKMLLVLARYRKFIVSLVVLSTLAAAVTVLVLPKWYRAKTSILPSQYDHSLGITGNFAQFTLSSAGFDLPIMATPSDVYATMLKSETVARNVIDELDLMAYFEQKTFQECYLYLKEKTAISITGEGVVELYFEDKDPEMAAKVANSFIFHLDQLNREVKAAKARSDREFILERLNTTNIELDSARARLLAFQTSNKAIDLDQQKKMALDAASALKTQLAMTQVSRDVKSIRYSPDHPDVLHLENEIKQLKKQLAIVEKGSGDDLSYFGLPLADIPELAIRHAELAADLAIQVKVADLLTGLYEEARIKEQKDTPTISILETAYKPEIKYRPRRTLILIVTFAASLVLAIFLALFGDYLSELRRLAPNDFELLKRTQDEFTGKKG
ncbi:MAG: hypothetical protein GY841_18985 [FCB group bacterium]|nr:hypothetical protein [FCB group bacterium]